VDAAKALACNRSVAFTKELCLFFVIVEGDSKQVVQAVTNKGENLTLFGHVIKEIQGSCSSLQGLVFNVLGGREIS